MQVSRQTSNKRERETERETERERERERQRETERERKREREKICTKIKVIGKVCNLNFYYGFKCYHSCSCRLELHKLKFIYNPGSIM